MNLQQSESSEFLNRRTNHSAYEEANNVEDPPKSSKELLSNFELGRTTCVRWAMREYPLDLIQWAAWCAAFSSLLYLQEFSKLAL